MRSHSIVARPPRRPAALAEWITQRDQGRFRSRLAGQAQAILTDPALTSKGLGGAQVSDGGRERRVVQAVRVGGVGVVGNIHATNAPATPALVALELARAASFLDSLAVDGEPRILAGDFNLSIRRSRVRERRPRGRPRARGRAPGVAVDRVAARATRAEWGRALGSRTGRASRRVTLEEARAQFPVLERIAYLNAGTFGPLARATYEALSRRARPRLQRRPQRRAELQARDGAAGAVRGPLASLRRRRPATRDADDEHDGRLQHRPRAGSASARRTRS